MRDDLAEQFLNGLEQSFRAVGASSYDEGVGVTIRFLEWISETAEQVRTRAAALEVLKKMPEPNEAELPFYLAGMHFLPQLITMGIQGLGKDMKADFPAKRGPKGKLTAKKQRRACQYIGKLIAEGVPLTVCQERTARAFHVSKRKIERVWRDRRKLVATTVPELDFNEVANWAKLLLSAKDGIAPSSVEGTGRNRTAE